MIKGVEEDHDRLFRHEVKGLKNLLEHLEGSKSRERVQHKTNFGDQSRLSASCGTIKVVFGVHFQTLNNHCPNVKGFY